MKDKIEPYLWIVSQDECEGVYIISKSVPDSKDRVRMYMFLDNKMLHPFSNIYWNFVLKRGWIIYHPMWNGAL